MSGKRGIIAEELSYVALVSADVEASATVFGRYLGLPRNELTAGTEKIPVFSVGKSALAVFPVGHPLVEGETKPGVHHIALGVDDLVQAAERLSAAGLGPVDASPSSGVGGRRRLKVAREATVGVRVYLTERLNLKRHAAGVIERIDHLGVASVDITQDEAIFSKKLGFEVESRQTDMEVSIAVESFTSDKYGVVYHARKPEPVGGLRASFITVGDCELEFLANFDPNQGGDVEHGRPGNTRQDQGAIARFVASRGRGLHHIALKSADINGTLAMLDKAGLNMIDLRGRPGGRRALIGFAHPKAMGGVLMHLVERP